MIAKAKLTPRMEIERQTRAIPQARAKRFHERFPGYRSPQKTERCKRAKMRQEMNCRMSRCDLQRVNDPQRVKRPKRASRNQSRRNCLASGESSAFAQRPTSRNATAITLQARQGRSNAVKLLQSIITNYRAQASGIAHCQGTTITPLPGIAD